MGFITTVKDIFSGDNTKIDFTHVNSGIWIFAILGMWMYKCFSATELLDIPPGVQMVLFGLIGAAPVSSVVTMGTAAYKAVRGASDTTVTTTVTTSDDGSAKPE